MAERKLHLIYTDKEGVRHNHELDDKPVVIGRDPSATIMLADERVTRRHCEIRLWNGDFVIKDLHSKNGTFINDEQEMVAILELNDIIKIGPFLLAVRDDASLMLGETQAGEILKEMDEGKGFNTIMHSIVDPIEKKPDPPKT